MTQQDVRTCVANSLAKLLFALEKESALWAYIYCKDSELKDLWEKRFADPKIVSIFEQPQTVENTVKAAHIPIPSWNRKELSATR